MEGDILFTPMESAILFRAFRWMIRSGHLGGGVKY